MKKMPTTVSSPNYDLAILGRMVTIVGGDAALTFPLCELQKLANILNNLGMGTL